MIKKRSLIFSMIFLWVSVAVVAQQQQKPKVDYRSDITNVINQGELIKLTGNVAFHHNGTIITCDTAYMYEDQNFEGVGNVIINSDSTYIYGDRFTYDEETSIARVYAPLIKTIDKDAILYTHNMEFNTLTSVGSYYDGGTITQNDNLMESERGDYYTETRDMILTGKVEMKNDDYVIKTDSVGFNLETEYVTFFTKTSIWNSNDEYLEAFNGSYDRRLDLYTFTDNAYMLTAEQEVWADSIRHWSRLSESELRQNIQILDTTQKVMVFGDYGHYWANIKRIIMTKDPSALSYNPDVESDSTFMRADTLLVYPMIERGRKIIKEKTSTLDSIGMEHNFDKLQFPDSIVSTPPSDITISNDSIYKQDYLHIDTTSTDVKKEAFVPKNKKDAKQHAKALKKEAKRLAKEEKQKNKPLRGWLTAAHD
ncbi:MAG: OstA-like protein, partial [Rikenellaceae bacterium]